MEVQQTVVLFGELVRRKRERERERKREKEKETSGKEGKKQE